MTMSALVLSLFPGIDGLGRGFEELGYCVVRGPDLLWGGDVRQFHPPAGRFDGVIGGPPCQMFSRLRYLNPLAGQKHGNLIPEFERVVAEAQPEWFVMENVPEAPEPDVSGYVVHSLLLNNRWLPGENDLLVGAEQHRRRRFSFGTRDGRSLLVDVAIFEAPVCTLADVTASVQTPVRLVRDGDGGHRPKRQGVATVLAGHGPVKRVVLATDSGPYAQRYTIAEMCRLQGFPEDFLAEAPFTVRGKRTVIGNAVPLFMARAIARAVRRCSEPGAGAERAASGASSGGMTSGARRGRGASSE